MFASTLFAYVGPDTFLPVTSALSALAGVVMFLWGTGARAVVRRVTGRLRRPLPSERRFARRRVGLTAARQDACGSND
jgi:hypothetical protein